MRILFILSFILCFFDCFSQMVVQDPTNYTVLSSQLEIARDQIKKSQETISTLKQANEFISKVNNAVEQLDMINGIIDIQKSTIKYTKTASVELGESGKLTNQEFKKITEFFSKSIQAISKNIEMAQKLLRSDYFKMNDADRIQFLKDLQIEAATKAKQLIDYKKGWDYTITKRLLLVNTEN